LTAHLNGEFQDLPLYCHIQKVEAKFEAGDFSKIFLEGRFAQRKAL